MPLNWSGAVCIRIGWRQCTITGYRLMTNVCFVNLDSHSSNYSNWTAWVWMVCLRQESDHQKIRVFFLSSGRDPRTTAAMVASMDEINLTQHPKRWKTVLVISRNQIQWIMLHVTYTYLYIKHDKTWLKKNTSTASDFKQCQRLHLSSQRNGKEGK